MLITNTLIYKKCQSKEHTHSVTVLTPRGTKQERANIYSMQFQSLTQHMVRTQSCETVLPFRVNCFIHIVLKITLWLWLSPFYGWKDWGTKEIRTLLVVASSMVWIAASVYLKGKWDPQLSPPPFSKPRHPDDSLWCQTRTLTKASKKDAVCL